MASKYVIVQWCWANGDADWRRATRDVALTAVRRLPNIFKSAEEAGAAVIALQEEKGPAYTFHVVAA